MVSTTPGRWLKHITDGSIYGYSDSLASNPDVREVTEEEAFPEKFIPAEQKGRKAKVSLSEAETQADTAVDKSKTKPELSADASQGLPTGKVSK